MVVVLQASSIVSEVGKFVTGENDGNVVEQVNLLSLVPLQTPFLSLVSTSPAFKGINTIPYTSRSARRSAEFMGLHAVEGKGRVSDS